jgi:hypothetical protein
MSERSVEGAKLHSGQQHSSKGGQQSMASLRLPCCAFPLSLSSSLPCDLWS